MKKIIILVVSILLIFNLIACKNNNTASSVVNKYCEALKNFDTETMTKCTGTETKKIDLASFEDDYMKDIIIYIEKYAKEIKYNIEEENIDGNKSIVKVKFEYVDLSKAFGKAIGDYFKEALAAAFGGKTDEKELAEKFANNFINNLEGQEKKNTVICDFVCEKVQDNWIISDIDTEKMADIASGGILSAVAKLGNSMK